jgi:hypothetical protein
METILFLPDSFDPKLVWGLFTRLLGVMFFISFASLSGQVVPAAGARGLMPVAKYFARFRSDFTAPRRYFYFPTLLWFSASDAMLRGLCFAGMAAGIGVIYGGAFSFPCLLFCYLAYLSLDLPMGLIFPWDCALFEASFFSLFLGPTLPLPELAAVHPPEPAIAWMYRLLLFRVLFGFGKFKFLGATKHDRGYLKGFLINQPLPSYIGWYMQKLPMWMLKGALFMMFITEIPLPLLLFFPGRASIIGGVAIFFLMIAIQACGSFGYFSLVMMIVCVTTLDSITPRGLGWSTMFATPSAAIASTIFLLHTFGALLNFAFNSWVSQRWFLWPHLQRIPSRILRAPLTFYRLLYPFRVFHSYGVFFPGTSPGIKCVPVMEFSWDGGETWIECPFKYATSLPSSAPKFVSPHHHRVDQALIYDVFGGNGSTPVWTITGSFSPYYYQPHSGARVGIHRMIEGYPYSGYIFDETNVPKNQGPPKLGRITIHMLEPVSLEEHKKTGNYWKRSYIGPHLPPIEKIAGYWERWIPVPELWHWDDLIWRRRSKLKRLMDRALRGEEARSALIADTQDITAADVEAFWNEMLPLVQSGDPRTRTFDRVPETVRALRAKYDVHQLYVFERIVGRLTTMLVAKLEPYFFRDKKPILEVKTYYHLSLLANQVILEGEAAFERLYRNPEQSPGYVDKVSMAEGVYLMTMFQYEAMIFQAQKRRLTQRFLFPERPGGMTKYDRDANILLEQLSGAMELMTFLEDKFIGPEFDHGFPEKYPTFTHQPDGEVAVRHYCASEA